MRESESIIMQIDIVDSLIHFIKSKYGVRTKAILMYERTEQIPLELLEPYVDLLNKNEMKFIEILSRTDDMVIIRYVDNALLQKKPFYFARNDLFNKYKEENDYFQLSIKNNVWGNMWENEKSIPYVRKLTSGYSYICFEKKYSTIVAYNVSQQFHFTPEIIDVDDIPEVCYMVEEIPSSPMPRYCKDNNARLGIWSYITQNLMIPAVQIDDIKGEIKLQHRSAVSDEIIQYRQGMRVDIKHVARSSWEANISRIFQKLGVPYEYEREAFSFDDFIYVPDFFLPNNIIVEVKGFWDNNSRRKVVTLKKNRPEYTILPIDSDMYESLRLKYSSQISQWEENVSVSCRDYEVSIVGMKFCASKETLQSLTVGDNLLLEREPKNRFDKNAILVKTMSGAPIGHFCADWAAVFAPKMDIGMTYHAKISDIQRSAICATVRRSNFDAEILYDFFT